MILPISIIFTLVPTEPTTGLVIMKFPTATDPLVIVEGVAVPTERSKEAYTAAMQGAIDACFSSLNGWSSTKGGIFRKSLAEQLAADALASPSSAS